jgi:hypothetical protein
MIIHKELAGSRWMMRGMTIPARRNFIVTGQCIGDSLFRRAPAIFLCSI